MARHLKIMLNHLALSYISSRKKAIRRFVKAAVVAVRKAQNKPQYKVVQHTGFIVPLIQRLLHAFKLGDVRVHKTYLTLLYPYSFTEKIKRVMLTFPKNSEVLAWSFLLKSSKVRLWFALLLRNPMLFFKKKC